MNASTQRHLRGMQRSVGDLMVHRDSIIEKPKSASTAAAGFKQMFDLAENLTGATVQLLVHTEDTKYAVALRGANKVVGCGSGWTLAGGIYSATLTASSLVYLKFSRATAAVTIETGTTPDASFVTPDDYNYRPLWFISVGGDPLAIDRDNCVSLRESFIVDGIS